MHIIKFGTSPGDFIGPFAFKSDAVSYATALSRGSHLPCEILPLVMPAFGIGNESATLQSHLLRQVLERGNV